MSSELHTVSLFSQYLIAAPTLTFSVLHLKALVFEYSLLICLVRSLYYTDTWLELTLGQWLCKFVCNLSCVMCYDTVRASWWEAVTSTDSWSGPGNVSRHVSREGALHAWGSASTQRLWDAPWNWRGMSLSADYHWVVWDAPWNWPGMSLSADEQFISGDVFKTFGQSKWLVVT